MCLDIVGFVIVVSGLGFLVYRLERSSEPNGSRDMVINST